MTVRCTRDLPHPSSYPVEILLVWLPAIIQVAEYNKSMSFNCLNCLDIRRSEPATVVLLVHRGNAPGSRTARILRGHWHLAVIPPQSSVALLVSD
jgi:hypothetical protein